MKSCPAFRYCGPISGLVPAARAALARQQAPADAARWELLPWLLFLLLAVAGANARPTTPLPAADPAGIAATR